MTITSIDPATGVDLAALPAPTLVEGLDVETIRDTALADLIALGTEQGLDLSSIQPGDVLMVAVEMFAYRELLLRARINQAARAVMPAFATGSDLDHIATRRALARRVIIPANPQTNTPAVLEDDATLRARILRAPETWSVAGPSSAYVAMAIEASPDVAFASVTSPDPGEVVVTIQARKPSPSSTGLASPALVASVADYLSAEIRRPLTDQVTVQSASILDVTITAAITTLPNVLPATPLAQARARLDQYLADNCRLGRDLNRASIIAALHVAGVANVALTSPANDVIATSAQACHVTAITITHAGVAQ